MTPELEAKINKISNTKKKYDTSIQKDFDVAALKGIDKLKQLTKSNGIQLEVISDRGSEIDAILHTNTVSVLTEVKCFNKTFEECKNYKGILLEKDKYDKILARKAQYHTNLHIKCYYIIFFKCGTTAVVDIEEADLGNIEKVPCPENSIDQYANKVLKYVYLININQFSIYE